MHSLYQQRVAWLGARQLGSLWLLATGSPQTRADKVQKEAATRFQARESAVMSSRLEHQGEFCGIRGFLGFPFSNAFTLLIDPTFLVGIF